MKLSLIIPCYNEASRGINTSRSLYNRLDDIRLNLNLPFDYEVIIVNDASKDSTKSLCEDFVSEHKLENWSVHTLAMNAGKGRSIMYGIKRAKGEFVAYIDADLCVSVEYMNQFFRDNDLQESVCYVGDRSNRKSVIMNKRSIGRSLVSTCSRAFTYMMLKLPVYDTQCGFKVFHKGRYLNFRPFVNGYKWLFDVELLYCLHKTGVTLKSSAVVWNNMESESTLSVIPALRHTFRDFVHFLSEKSDLDRDLIDCSSRK